MDRKVYKAINQQTGEAIIILDDVWVTKSKALKEMSQKDILVCPGCKHPVNVRFGKIRRPHFAHRRLDQCPYAVDSPALLDARALLYRWLMTKFKTGVTIEKTLEGYSLPRYFDCWVETDHGIFAYWILEKGMKVDDRATLNAVIRSEKVNVNVIFTSAMLREEVTLPNTIRLSTTERELARFSDYDKPLRQKYTFGKSLHYLDTDSEALITYRALRERHGVQQFQGERLSNPFSDVRVLPRTGEFVHPGEHERLQEFLKTEPKEKETEVAYAHYLQGLKKPPVETASMSLDEPFKRRKPLIEKSEKNDLSMRIPFEKQEATCIFCGEKTNDWWTLLPDGTCKCKTCLENGRH